MQLNPKLLLLAPPLVWAAVGLTVLLDGPHAMDYFPFFWVANDVAVMAAFAGLMLLLFRGAPHEAPPVDEWTGWRPDAAPDPPLEEMLVALARAVEREAPSP